MLIYVLLEKKCEVLHCTAKAPYFFFQQNMPVFLYTMHLKMQCFVNIHMNFE